MLLSIEVFDTAKTIGIGISGFKMNEINVFYLSTNVIKIFLTHFADSSQYIIIMSLIEKKCCV